MRMVPPSAPSAARDRLAAVEQACDSAFLHLVGAGVVGTHPEDLVTATLRQIMLEAHQLHEDELTAARRL